MCFDEEDMLMLSGIQHFAFCPRQWALIHIEQEWADNRLTTEGTIMHQHVDDPFYRQKIGDTICLRSVSIASKSLGLYGLSDVVELYPTDSAVNAITHPKYPGYWTPYPVEYKHGKSKKDNIDVVQLTAQAMCLEEQYDIEIVEGALYYCKTRSREIVRFTDDLRQEVRCLASAMHAVYDKHDFPKVEQHSACKSCSMVDICMPIIASESAGHYLRKYLYEETT